MKFVRFDGFYPRGNKTQPRGMAVGQVIERHSPCAATRSRLAMDMRKGMEEGMEFSVAD